MSVCSNKYPLLSQVNIPKDLKEIAKDQLPFLAEEIRQYLINSLDIAGGHFASSLGVLELSIALHYVFDTPEDNIIWDVGHQSYVHKILTGRKNQLTNIKKPDGISGFPNRSESEYDAFGVGHSSTSISAGLGMAVATRLKNETKKTVAIIGDGAMTAGIAFEALNHAGGLHENMLVILNDNDMSISENVGALSGYLTKLFSGSLYTSLRENSKKLFEKVPSVWEFAKKFESQTKGMLMPGNLFEAFDFYYVGPIDGHDLDSLLQALESLKSHKGPRLLHIITKKGKGYAKAEQDPIKFHHVSPSFHSNGGDIEVDEIKAIKAKQSLSNVFGKWICDKAEKNNQLVGITPAMKEGSDLVEFAKRFPDRFFDVAIAEQHAVTFAAGLACEGFKPVIAIYSTFLQRAYDQFIHDISLQNLNVLYAIDRAGLVGADGPTHAGSFDLSYMRCIPNTIIMTPSDENECYHLLDFGYQYKGPAAVRYPRGSATHSVIGETLNIQLGKANIIKKGSELVILCFGTVLKYALEAANKVNATVVDMRFVKPLDEKLITFLAKDNHYFITIEENVLKGGAGSAVNEFLLANDLHQNLKIRNIALPDYYQQHGKHTDMLADIGISTTGILNAYHDMQK